MSPGLFAWASLCNVDTSCLVNAASDKRPDALRAMPGQKRVGVEAVGTARKTLQQDHSSPASRKLDGSVVVGGRATATSKPGRGGVDIDGSLLKN